MPVRHTYTEAMIELRHLRYFEMTAELGSISRAAAALHMTQPALSRQLAQLERDVGYSLFDRTPRGAKLTPAGDGLRLQAAVILSQVDRIPEVVSAYDRREFLLHMAIPSGVPEGWFEDFYERLSALIPHLRVSLREATTEEQRRMLSSHEIDIGILHSEAPEHHCELIFTQPFGFAIRNTSRFDSVDSLSLADLEGARVMAHNTERFRLRAVSAAEDLRIDWDFRRFSEYSRLIVDSADADAVLIGEASARRYFPDWPWVPMRHHSDIGKLRSWAAWADPDMRYLHECLTAMREALR